MRLHELDLHYELGSPKPDTQKIQQMVTNLKNLQGDMLELRVDAILKIRNVLTPEQYKKFEKYGVDIMQTRLRELGRAEKESLPPVEG